MSISPVSRGASECKAIPKRMLITDPANMPTDYSTTPGGTMYSTTPGGTKIVYERAFLLNLRNSPISQTPPKCAIPSGLVRGAPHSPVGSQVGHALPVATLEDPNEQFQIEI